MPKVVITDETPMPFGKHKGIAMANVPASYLLWLHDNGQCFGAMKDYLDDNYDALLIEAKVEREGIKTRKS